jgi:hypothetical protein
VVYRIWRSAAAYVTQSKSRVSEASKAVRLSVPSARASRVLSESIRSVKVLGFMGLDGLSCVHVA